MTESEYTSYNDWQNAMLQINRLEEQLAQVTDDRDTARAKCAEMRRALEHYAKCSDGCTCGDGWSHDTAREALSDAPAPPMVLAIELEATIRLLKDNLLWVRQTQSYGCEKIARDAIEPELARLEQLTKGATK